MIILGESFSAYAKATNSLLVNEFLLKEEKEKAYIIGQGLSYREYQQVLETCYKHDIKLIETVNYANSASRETTHKHNQENILISKPRRLNGKIFESELIIFQNNELIIDHQTGLHVQGMILIEAIRQMFIAVVEKYFSQENKSYVVFNNLTVDFKHFVFPFKIKINQEIINTTKKRVGTVAYESKFQIFQLDKVVLSAHASYTVYDRDFIKMKEKEIAEITTLQLIEQL